MDTCTGSPSIKACIPSAWFPPVRWSAAYPLTLILSLIHIFRLALISAGAVTGLTFLVGMKPFVGKSTDELLNEVKHLPSTLGEEIELFLSQRRRKTETTETGTVPMPPSDTPATSVAPRRMNEKRSFLMFLLVGILTCGVYIWYVYYTLARDVYKRQGLLGSQ